ncbi:MAG: hypothetical protein J7L61_04410, partial [Thermoplasmata archaeon]|nr:hypothetical protein [Thermoplasmata archaeon]
RLINALEDLKVEEDGSVRNTSGTVVQFVYGEDGTDPSKSIGGKAVDVERIVVSYLKKKEREGRGGEAVKSSKSSSKAASKTSKDKGGKTGKSGGSGGSGAKKGKGKKKGKGGKKGGE